MQRQRIIMAVLSISIIIISLLMFGSYYGYLGGRLIFPRGFSEDRSHNILQHRQAIRIAEAILEEVNAGQHLDKLHSLKYTLGYGDIAKLQQVMSEAKLSDRLNWAILLSGEYDKYEGTYIVWLNCGIYLELSLKGNNLRHFTFKVKG